MPGDPFQKIKSDAGELFDVARAQGIRASLHWLVSPDAPVTFQFMKYAMMGAGSTVVHLAVFAIVSHTIFPAHDYLEIEGLDDAVKEKHAIWSNLIAFPFSNLFAYLTNARFVFTGGRHSRIREVSLFTMISFASFIAGLISGPILISRGLNPWFAQFGFMIASALVNFVSRKFLVFSR